MTEKFSIDSMAVEIRGNFGACAPAVFKRDSHDYKTNPHNNHYRAMKHSLACSPVCRSTSFEVQP